MKRFFDLLLACLALIILSPLMLILAAAVKISSPGTVFFTQRRVGRQQKEFLIYKFRTMRSDAPKNVPTHLLGDAMNYITPLGRFMRRTSLDEIPQIFNIIKGDMSVVGPRPALYNQADLIALREQYGINDIKPGLTGWAQCNGRDELPIPVKVNYDRYYLENHGFWLDIKIIYKTFVHMFTGKGVREGQND